MATIVIRDAVDLTEKFPRLLARGPVYRHPIASLPRVMDQHLSYRPLFPFRDCISREPQTSCTCGRFRLEWY